MTENLARVLLSTSISTESSLSPRIELTFWEVLLVSFPFNLLLRWLIQKSKKKYLEAPQDLRIHRNYSRLCSFLKRLARFPVFLAFSLSWARMILFRVFIWFLSLVYICFTYFPGISWAFVWKWANEWIIYLNRNPHFFRLSDKISISIVSVERRADKQIAKHMGRINNVIMALLSTTPITVLHTMPICMRETTWAGRVCGRSSYASSHVMLSIM